MSRRDFDLLVVGGGSAGLTVAAGAARLGVKTLLVEREPALGGDCLHYGCVPSKTLIKSARVRHLQATAGRYGLPAPELPPVHFPDVAGRIRQVIEAIQAPDSPARFRRLGAEVLFGPARFLDDHALDVGGSRVTADKIVLATGSAASAPAIPGLDKTPFLTNREIFSQGELPESLVILGAGPIGIEMAQAFARLGSRVSVIHRGGGVLGKEDPDMAGLVQKALEGEGVRFLLNSQVKLVSGDERRVVVTFESPEGQGTLEASKLLVALGRNPNIQDLDCPAAGVEFTDRGIAVDRRQRTSQKHIFAAGDCAGRFLFTHAAGYEGSIAVSNAVFHLPRKADYAWLPWCTFTDPELASIGHNETSAKKSGLEFDVYMEEFSANDRAQAEGESGGRLKLLLGHGGRPLGVQILAPRAGELINEWVSVLGGGVRLSTLAGAMHPYPTLGELNKRVAGSVLADKIFSPRVRKILRFFFRYRGSGPEPDAR